MLKSEPIYECFTYQKRLPDATSTIYNTELGFLFFK